MGRTGAQGNESYLCSVRFFSVKEQGIGQREKWQEKVHINMQIHLKKLELTDIIDINL